MSAPRAGTLLRGVTIVGTGLHTGEPCALHLKPAQPGSGYLWIDNRTPKQVELRAVRRELALGARGYTALMGRAGDLVKTVEHLFAALAGLGISDLGLAFEGPELPALDGSAGGFVRAILEQSPITQHVPRVGVRIAKHTEVHGFGGQALAMPSSDFSLTVEVEFEGGPKGRFGGKVEDCFPIAADAKTFVFESAVEAMQKKGLGLGANEKNTRVIAENSTDQGVILHKWIDALGDIALLGYPIQGHFLIRRGSHRLHATLRDAVKLERAMNWGFDAA